MLSTGAELLAAHRSGPRSEVKAELLEAWANPSARWRYPSAEPTDEGMRDLIRGLFAHVDRLTERVRVLEAERGR